MSAALRFDDSVSWQTAESEHFLIHFHTSIAALVPRVAEMAEATHASLSQKFQWKPKQPTHLVLTDRFDYTNGFATTFPRNTMTIIVTPPDRGALTDYDEWLALLIRHEYTHIIHIDKVRGLPAGLRQVLGRMLWTFPNGFAPTWLIEGLATFEETDQDAGLGRGQNSYFRMLMRLEVARGIKPLKEVSQPISSWPWRASSYLYGVYFFNFVAQVYGEEKALAYVDAYSGNVIPYILDTRSEQVFGKSLPDLWLEFEEWLRAEFEPQLAAIVSEGVHGVSRLSHNGYDTGYPQAQADGSVLYVKRNGLASHQLMRWNPQNQASQLVTEFDATQFDSHPSADLVYLKRVPRQGANSFNEIFAMNLTTGVNRQLTQQGRYRYVAWHPEGASMLGVRNEAGLSVLQLLNAEGALVTEYWRGEPGVVVSKPVWHPSGLHIYASVLRPGRGWNIEAFDVTTRTWQALTTHPAIETDVSLFGGGEALLYSADYDGVFNLYRLDLHTREVLKLTNLIGGAFHATSSDGKAIYFQGFHGEGSDLYQVNVVNPLSVNIGPQSFQEKRVALPENGSDSALRVSGYEGSEHVLPQWWFPFFRTTDARNEWGFITSAADPLQVHSYQAYLGYDLENKWGIGTINYLFDGWPIAINVFASRYYNQLTTGSSPWFSRVNYLTTDAIWPLPQVEDSWEFRVGVRSKTERVVNRSGRFDDNIFGIGLSYNSVEAFPYQPIVTRGSRFNMTLESSDILKSDYTGIVYKFDGWLYSPLTDRQTLHTRLAIGWGTRSPDRFELGGSGDAADVNVFQQGTIFSRRELPLRGYDEGLPQLRGRRMALLSNEWHFPIATIDRALMPLPVGVGRIHGAAIFDVGSAWETGYASDYYRGLGLEIYSELVLGYRLITPVTVGWVRGLDRGGDTHLYVNMRALF